MRKSPYPGGGCFAEQNLFCGFFSKSKILEEIFIVQILCFIR